MYCTNITKIIDPRFPSLQKEMYVPCKQCTACRINKTSEWTLRIMMELQQWESARFITLTYRPGTTPTDKTLVKEDLSDFFKALRQNLDGRKIRYFACGEYGQRENDPTDWEKGKRPHYHAIVFGLTDSLEDRKAVFNAWGRSDEFQWFGKEWRKSCGDVTPDSARYVAGYCQKKLNGKLGEEEYLKTNRIAPFQHQSKQIGEEYFLNHIEQYKKDGFILFNGKRHAIPETWKRKFDIEFPEIKDSMYEENKQRFLNIHTDISPGYYDWVYRRFGYTLFDDDIESYITRATINETIKAKNNLRKKENLL